jgi:hypothetical protein
MNLRFLTARQYRVLKIAYEQEIGTIFNPTHEPKSLWDELTELLSEHLIRITDVVLFEVTARDNAINALATEGPKSWKKKLSKVSHRKPAPIVVKKSSSRTK